MDHSKIAVRYARALFDLAEEHKVVEAIYSDMKAVNSVCSLPEMKEIITNPVIPFSKRTEIIVAVAGGGLNDFSRRFIELMFLHGRGDHLSGAARNFISLTRKHRGIREVTLTTAIPASNEIKQKLSALVERSGEKIEFNEHTDSSLIGGFILRVDDEYIDASVRSRLNRFRKEFSLAENAPE